MSAKPLKFHQTLNQPPRNAKHGQHRRTSPPVHSRPAGQSGNADPWGATFFTTLWTVPAPAEPKPIENAGIRAGEIIAHRGWRVENGLLVSIYKREHVWVPGAPMTGDVRGEYGVHAFKTAEQVEEYYEFATGWSVGWVVVQFTANGPEFEPVGSPIFAVGTVALWGEVIEHERGYRAEFAKVISIDKLSERDDAALADLRARYLPSFVSPFRVTGTNT